MVLNAAVQMLREADDLKEAISKFKSGTSMLQEHSLWTKQQQLQKIYQKVLILDLDYALDKKVEQDLWNVGFKQQIDALQAISKDRKNPLRSEGQAMVSWVLQAAAGFYLCLLHQVCTTYQLDLPFRRRASLLGSVEGWSTSGGAGGGAPAAARYVCQHCLVHLGDLARYRHQLRVAHTFYRHALVVSVHSGQPYNQLALLAWRRSRRLAAVYWHVRSVLVRAPFPPAPHNLARTLRAAAATHLERSALPVVPGVECGGRLGAPAPQRLDAHVYVTQLIRALHYIHTGDELDTAEELVKALNSSLSTLIATDSFESMTLIKMAVVLMWSVHDATEDLTLVDEDAPATEGERRAAQLALALAAGALLALLLPAYSAAPPAKALPAVKVWLEWVVSHARAVRSTAWAARPALWPALAHTLNQLAAAPSPQQYDSTPLPEEEELHGFVPLEEALRHRAFTNHARAHQQSPPVEVRRLAEEPGLEERLRAHRLVQLGRRLAELAPDHLSYTEEDDKVTFTAAAAGGEQLSLALAELAEGREAAPTSHDSDHESDDDLPPPRAPTVISEADFREKVIERRAGILKPQGSLERAREERALHTHDELDECSEDSSKCEDKRERKPRINIAMAAILRKQEDSNKQVKFVTPPPTPETMTDSTEPAEDKPKVVQPKPIKSLDNLPLGRKTGGILSLKDKSGYPHLVNSPEKEEKKERPSPPAQREPPVQREPLVQNWSNPAQNFEPRMPYPGELGPRPHDQGILNNFSPNSNYRPPLSPGIRLPVVNPKEIDVRSAALQKQNSRRDTFQDGNKHVSTDKRNFLNDLPPRFANQYRYWQAAHENREENSTVNLNSNWPPQNSYPSNPGGSVPPNPWWKPDEPPPQTNFNYNPVLKPNYFAPNINNNPPNPYRNLPTYNPNQTPEFDRYTNIQNPNLASHTNIQRPMQSLQSLQGLTPDFGSSLTGFGSYNAQIPYDAGMYPQFANSYRPLQTPSFREKEVDFGEEMKRRIFESNSDANVSRNEQNKVVEGEAPGNTYSLFSGAPPAAWPAHQHHQSLWSGPGPSPLERLLEQQKQMGQPPAPH